MPDLAELWGLRVELEQVQLAKRKDGPAWQRAWRQRERWDPRWARETHRVLDKTKRGVDFSKLARAGLKAHGVGRLKKAKSDKPTAEEVAALLEQQVDEQGFEEGFMAVYLALGLDESEDAGQHTLDSLGLNETFAWATPRDFAGNVLAIHGSKIVQGIYGTHIDTLAKMVVEKCDPRHPKTIGQLTKEIQAEWSALTRKQAERIARTEAAFVWEATNYNVMNLNGVESVDWLIAVGPSIGKSVGPVCQECLALAAQAPYILGELDEIPPAHPHCRCTLVPRYDEDWLPPAEPFVGGDGQLEVFA